MLGLEIILSIAIPQFFIMITGVIFLLGLVGFIISIGFGSDVFLVKNIELEIIFEVILMVLGSILFVIAVNLGNKKIPRIE